MKNVIVYDNFIEYIKDFIPKDHKPNECKLLSIEFGYRSCRFTYWSPVCDNIHDYVLTIDAY